MNPAYYWFETWLKLVNACTEQMPATEPQGAVAPSPETDIAALRHQCEDLQERFDTDRQTNARDRHELEQRLATERHERAAADAEATRLREEMAKASSFSPELETEAASARDEARHLQGALAEAGAEAQRLRAELATAEARAERLRDEHLAAETAREEAVRVAAGLEAELVAVRDAAVREREAQAARAAERERELLAADAPRPQARPAALPQTRPGVAAKPAVAAKPERKAARVRKSPAPSSLAGAFRLAASVDTPSAPASAPTDEAPAGDAPALPVSAPEPTPPPPATPVQLVVRFRRPEDWAEPVFLHYWDSEPPSEAPAWPGRPMTPEADGWWVGRIEGVRAANLVFTDVAGNQTGNQRRDRAGRLDSDGNWLEDAPATA